MIYFISKCNKKQILKGNKIILNVQFSTQYRQKMEIIAVYYDIKMGPFILSTIKLYCKYLKIYPYYLLFITLSIIIINSYKFKSQFIQQLNLMNNRTGLQKQENNNNFFIKNIENTRSNLFEANHFFNYNTTYQPRFIRDKHKNIIQNKTFNDVYIKSNTSSFNSNINSNINTTQARNQQNSQIYENQQIKYQGKDKNKSQNQLIFQMKVQKQKRLKILEDKQKQNYFNFLNISCSKISQIQSQNSINNSSYGFLKNEQINEAINFNFTLPNVSMINQSTIVGETISYEQQHKENQTHFEFSDIKLDQNYKTKNQILNQLLFSKSQQPQQAHVFQNQQQKDKGLKTCQKQLDQETLLTKKKTNNSTYKKIFLEYSPADDNSQANVLSSSKKTISQSFITYNNDQNSLLLSGFNQEDMAISAYINKSNNLSKIQVQQYVYGSILQKVSQHKSNQILHQESMNLYKCNNYFSTNSNAELSNSKNQYKNSQDYSSIFEKSPSQNLQHFKKDHGINDSKRDIQIFAGSTDNVNNNDQKLRYFERQTEIKTSQNQNSSLDTSLFLLQGYNSTTPKKQVKPLSLAFLNRRTRQTTLQIVNNKNNFLFKSFCLFQNQLFEIRIFSLQKIIFKFNQAKIFNFSQQFQVLSLLKRLKQHFQKKNFKIYQFYKTFCKALTQDDFSLLKKYFFLNNIVFKNDQFTQMLFVINNCINKCLNNTKIPQDVSQWQIFESFLFSSYNQVTQPFQFQVNFELQALKRLNYKNIWDFMISQEPKQQKFKQILLKEFTNLIKKLIKA